MQVQSLSELRADIENEEVSANANTAIEVEQPQAEVVVDVVEASPEETQSSKESASEGDEKPEWAKTEGQAVPVAKYVELKHKLRATREETSDVIERLRQENEALKRGVVQPQAVAIPKAPTLDECGYDEAIFAQKNAEYVDALIESKLAAHTHKAQSTQANQVAEQSLKQDVDKHYERASEFVRKGVVSEENYRNADAAVRNRLNNIIPGMGGDSLTDTLIANLGEGSEKIIYHLGANPQALMKLESDLRADPTGLRASVYLGGLKTKFESAATNKLSSAPRPDVALKGNASLSTKNHRDAFDKAVKSGDIGVMLQAKRAAKAAGVDVSKWD